MPRAPAPETADVVVIGAGFGGLGAAIGLAERGARVVLCETLDYPGGCAGTFTRRGARYDAGATLSSGLAPGQLFAGWLDRYGILLQTTALDPVVELRAPGLTLAVAGDRRRFIAELAALAGSRAPALRRFFDLQGRVADLLWGLLERPALLPPLGPRALGHHLLALPRYLPLLRWVGQPLVAVLAHFGIADLAPLRLFCDAVCQITVQCNADEAEAPLALATLDYFFRGVAHVDGGIGELARALTQVFFAAGAAHGQRGQLLYHCPVRGLAREGALWRVDTRRGPIRAPRVVANLLPQALRRLLPPSGPRLAGFTRALESSLEDGWSAAILYLRARPPEGAPPGAHHLELIGDPAAPLIEGNHLFASISGAAERGRAPPGERVITVSTHLPAARLRGLSPDQTATYVAAIQARMREVFRERAPEWASGITQTMTASPRTFERYTRRPGGLVGGAPRRVSPSRFAPLQPYRGASPRAVAPGLWLVGDSIFPGQSTLAAALGGLRTAAAIRLPGPRRRPLPEAPDAPPGVITSGAL